jgi:hypothetical protein
VRVDWFDDIRLVPTWTISLPGATGQTFALDAGSTAALTPYLRDGSDGLLRITVGPSGTTGGGGHAIGEWQLWQTQSLNPGLHIMSNFNPGNGLDMAGHRLTRVELIVDGFDESGFDYRYRLYGEPVPEPRSYVLFVIGWVLMHHRTPYGADL